MNVLTYDSVASLTCHVLSAAFSYINQHDQPRAHCVFNNSTYSKEPSTRVKTHYFIAIKQT